MKNDLAFWCLKFNVVERNPVKIWSCDEHKKPKQTLSGHFGYVVDVAWADVDTLVSGSYDGAVKVWNSSSGECLYSLVRW